MSARFLSRVLPEWGDGEPGGRDGWRRAGCAAGPAAGRRRPGPLREELGRGRQSQPPPPGSGAQCCRAPVTPGAHGRLRGCPRSSASKRGPLIVQLSDRWRSCGGTKLACHSAVKIPVKPRRGGRGVTHSTHPHPDAAPSLHTPALLHGLDSDGNVRNRAHRGIFHLQSELAGDRRDGRADRSLGLQASGRRGAGGGWGAVLGHPEPSVCASCSRPARGQGKQGRRADGATGAVEAVPMMAAGQRLGFPGVQMRSGSFQAPASWRNPPFQTNSFRK